MKAPIEFEYVHEGDPVICKAIFEPGDDSVGIGSGWVVVEATFICVDAEPNEEPYPHETYDRDEIEDKYGTSVLFAMDEAAQAVAEERDAAAYDVAMEAKGDAEREGD